MDAQSILRLVEQKPLTDIMGFDTSRRGIALLFLKTETEMLIDVDLIFFFDIRLSVITLTLTH